MLDAMDYVYEVYVEKSFSAAAKKLSKYGAAIKISTDGYIDVFVNEELVYSIK